MVNHMKPFLIGALSLLALPLFTFAQTESYTVTFPDVKEEFCGVHVNFQYCKCAFHGDYCDAVGQNQSGAYTYVMEEYRRYTGDLIENAARRCLEDNDRWDVSSRTCFISNEPEPELPPPLEEQYEFPNMVGVPEPVTSGYYGKVSETDGEVFVYQWSFKRWVRAFPGMPLYHGDFVKTLEGRSRIIVQGEQYGDEVMRLANETILDIGRIAQDVPRPEGSLLLGVVREGAVQVYDTLQEGLSDKPPVPEWYIQLHSPTVAAGVRGTHFAVSVESGSGNTKIALNEGLLDLKAIHASETVPMRPGRVAEITSTKLATTSRIGEWDTLVTEAGLLNQRIDASPEEQVHDAPTIPVDHLTVPEPTREELVGDTTDIDAMMPTPGGSSLWLWLLAVVGFAGGFWFYRHQQHETTNPAEET